MLPSYKQAHSHFGKKLIAWFYVRFNATVRALVRLLYTFVHAYVLSGIVEMSAFQEIIATFSLNFNSIHRHFSLDKTLVPPKMSVFLEPRKTALFLPWPPCVLEVFQWGFERVS